jgi:nucleoside-diphosphate-sugar epimerase
MRILITGSSGFIGNELKKYLEDKYDIIEYDIANGKDILDLNNLREKMKDCEIVVHLAAHRKPYEDKTFEDYFKTNCEGTFNVVKVAEECGIKKLIYTSSTSFYGAEGGVPQLEKVQESSPILTQFAKIEDLTTRDCDVAYSTSKVIGEQILANYGLTKKIQIIILRIAPTREKGKYKPFGNLKLHLKIENCLQVIKLAINCNKEMWYEYFTIADEIENVDISKAKRMLGYSPS